MRIRYLWLFIWLAATALCAADFDVSASVDNNRIGVEDRLVYTITIEGKDANHVAQPELPDIPGFRSLGSSQSSSSSVSIINGSMQMQSSVAYHYTLQPLRVGTFTIPPVMVRHGNRTVGTKAITVQVLQGSTQSRSRSAQPDPFGNFFGNQPPATPSTPQTVSKNDLFISADVDKTSVYQGEAITVHYTLFSAHELNDLAFADPPDYNGFWKEETFRAKHPDWQRVSRNGRYYMAMPLLTLTLTPNRDGKLVIPGLPMNAVYSAPSNFFGFSNPVQTRVVSPDVPVTVKPLPTEGRPANFSGAVGSFEVSADLTPQRLRAGEAFTLTLHVKGSGSIPSFTAPDAPQAPNIRFLDPETLTQTGERAVKYAGIAQAQGDYTIPALEFVYFDPRQGKYITKTTPSFPLKVDAGLTGAMALLQGGMSVVPTDIVGPSPKLALHRYRPLTESIPFWLLFLLAGATIPWALREGRRRERLAGDSDYRREHYADGILKRYLRQATAARGSLEFYAAANTGMANYLCDVLRIPRGSQTAEIIVTLREAEVSEPVIEGVELFLRRCQEARFMPGGFDPAKAQEDFLLMKKLLEQLAGLKKGWKNHRGGVA